jgi:hypothetical protein
MINGPAKLLLGMAHCELARRADNPTMVAAPGT